jgi:GNAT superfamily N-acetyltransferase
MNNGSSHTGVVIKRISSDKMADMEKLYANTYHSGTPKDYYANKFATTFSAITYAGFIAYTEQGIPIASLCLIPCFIVDGKERILAAQLTDGMTDPAYRRTGLFGQLTEHVIQFASESGIRLLFGFPNQDASRLLARMGWEEKEKLDRFCIPVKHSLGWLQGRARRFFKMNHRHRKLVSIAESGIQNSVFTSGFAGIERDSNYLLYKSFSSTGVIEAGSSKAWIKPGRDLSIGDMEVSVDDFPKVMESLQQIAQQTGAGKIYFQCSPGTILHQLFSKYYKPVPSFPVLFKKLDPGIHSDKIKFTFADIDIF